MPRPPRSYTSGIYHLAAHGSDDRSLFDDDGDRTAFLDRLGLTFSSLGVELISYVLMGNHYHALAYTPDARLARALQSVHGGYSLQRNRLRGRKAHLFRAHCLARRIVDNDDLVWVCRYLARNPVDAGIVLSPIDWPWASSRVHAGVEPSRVRLYEEHLQDAFGSAPTWRERYRSYIEPDAAPITRVAGRG